MIFILVFCMSIKIIAEFGKKTRKSTQTHPVQCANSDNLMQVFPYASGALL